MRYRCNRLDEPIFIAMSKPILTEFGIHHIDWRVVLTFPLLLIPSGPNCPAKSEIAVPRAPGRSKHGGPGNCKVQTQDF